MSSSSSRCLVMETFRGSGSTTGCPGRRNALNVVLARTSCRWKMHIIIIIIISFMPRTYTCIPETIHVPRQYSVAAILYLLFMVHITLFIMLNLLHFYISTFHSVCAVPNMAVFCSSLISCFPGMLLRYFLNDFEMVPVAPIITGITFVFTFHMRCISTLMSLYFRIFSASFFITLPSPETATSINTNVPFSLSLVIMSGLLLGMVLSVCTCWVQNMVTLTSWHVCTEFGTCSYRCYLSSFTPVALHTYYYHYYYYYYYLFMY